MGESQGYGSLEHSVGVRGDQGWADQGGIGSNPTGLHAMRIQHLALYCRGRMLTTQFLSLAVRQMRKSMMKLCASLISRDTCVLPSLFLEFRRQPEAASTSQLCSNRQEMRAVVGTQVQTLSRHTVGPQRPLCFPGSLPSLKMIKTGLMTFPQGWS